MTANNIVWHHAVNDLTKLDVAIADLVAAGAQGSARVVGVECDLRYRSHDGITVLSHDPISDSNDDELLPATVIVEILCTVVAANPTVTCVLKLDFKDWMSIDQLCSRDDYLAKALEPVRPRLTIWGNADLVPHLECDPDVFAEAFPTPGQSCEALMNVSDVLSIGFYRPAAAVAPYYDEDRQAMSSLVTDVARWKTPQSPVTAVTFALRYSLVRGSDKAVAAVRAMVKDAQQLLWPDGSEGVVRAFVTFWRARHETITDEDMHWILREFPTATVDRD